MAGRKTAPYGSWKSPITSEILAAGSSLPSELTIDSGTIYWLELRPEEGGRYGLYSLADGGETEEVVPDSFDVRTRVHEYGGGSYVVDGSVVYFSNFRDQLVYRLDRGGDPHPITKAGLRYADYVVDAKRKRLIGVCEDHSGKASMPVNSIAGIAADGSSSKMLVSGNDFYSSPRIDPSGSRLAWVTWNFPRMPWDGTELWVGRLANDGSVVGRKIVAGGAEESVVMPTWSPEGTLYFVSDRGGFWNIYRSRGASVERVTRLEADVCPPHWVFRMSSYAFDSDGKLVFTYCEDGTWHLAVLEPLTGRVRRVRSPYSFVRYLSAHDGNAYFVGGSPTEPVSVVRLSLSDSSVKALYRPPVPKIDERFVSKPRHVRFATTGGKRAYAFLYTPANRDFKGPRGEKPPLVVVSHGGPTSQANTFLNFDVQYWSTRGFAVLDVNYGGSSGYGRAYRERLAGRWGVVDVDDCVNGALWAVKRGIADRQKLIIRGGSAGGYTTLCAMAFRRVFTAGASYFGVSDVEALAKDTHKFESRYLDKLIAPYPEGREFYRQRSAIHFPDMISAPMIFFQGLEDVVVPPSQAEKMVGSLRERGLPVAYVAFEGEQHGLRRAENIERAIEAELYFYSKVFGFKLAGRIEPVEVMNLGGWKA